MKMNTIISASLLLLVSVQINASIIYLGGAGSDLYSLDIDTGVATSLFSVPFFTTSGLANSAPVEVPEPAALLLFLTGIIGLGIARRRDANLGVEVFWLTSKSYLC